MISRENHNRRRSGASTLVVLDVLLLLMILATAVHTIVVSRMRTLGPTSQYLHNFWQQRASELCVERTQIPKTPELGVNSDPLQQLAFLAQLTDFSRQVWDKYQDCQEPLTVVYNEDLLHFRVDRHNEFEADPEPAFAKIRAFVEQNLKGRNQIYILGHTDDTFTEEYNYQLSYLRALEITRVIQRHLAATGKQQGRDYALYPVGMGKAQLLKQQPNEAVERWRTRCRRIELSFRSLPGSSRAKGQS